MTGKDKNPSSDGTAVAKYTDDATGQLKRVIDNGNVLNRLPSNIDLNLYTQGLYQAIDNLGIKSVAEINGVILAVGELVVDGLLPNNKEAALIPYKSKKVGDEWIRIYTAVRMVRGILKIAYESGIKNWQVFLHYENDHFIPTLGTDIEIDHVPTLDDPGEIKGVYGVATLPNGTDNVEWMRIAEVWKIRNAVFAKLTERTSFGKTVTVAQQIESHVWTLHPEEMIKKTLLHRQMKRMPMVECPRLREYFEREIERQEREMGDLKVVSPDNNNGEDAKKTTKKTPNKTTKSARGGQNDEILSDDVQDAVYEDVGGDTGGNTEGGRPLPTKKQEELDAVHKELDKNGGGAGAGGQGGKTGGASRTTNGGGQNGGSDGDPRPTPPPPSDSWGS